MLTSIIAILAALIPLFVWLIRRHVTNEDDPYTQHTEKREQLAKEIIHNDESAANQSLDDELERLRVLTLPRSDAPHALPDAPDRLRSLQSDRLGQNSSPR